MSRKTIYLIRVSKLFHFVKEACKWSLTHVNCHCIERQPFKGLPSNLNQIKFNSHTIRIYYTSLNIITLLHKVPQIRKPVNILRSYLQSNTRAPKFSTKFSISLEWLPSKYSLPYLLTQSFLDQQSHYDHDSQSIELSSNRKTVRSSAQGRGTGRGRRIGSRGDNGSGKWSSKKRCAYAVRRRRSLRNWKLMAFSWSRDKRGNDAEDCLFASSIYRRGWR